jgi:hypothetical protein
MSAPHRIEPLPSTPPAGPQPILPWPRRVAPGPGY